MPVTRSRTYNADMEDSHNTTGFLFGDEDSQPPESRPAAQTNVSDGFPTLLRQQGFPGHLVSFSCTFSGSRDSHTAASPCAVCPSYSFAFGSPPFQYFYSLIMNAPWVTLPGSRSNRSTFPYDPHLPIVESLQGGCFHFILRRW